MHQRMNHSYEETQLHLKLLSLNMHIGICSPRASIRREIFTQKKSALRVTLKLATCSQE